MFDEMQRFLRNLNGRQVTISVPCEADAEGYLDKECPNTSCEFDFKIHEDDWRDIVRGEEVFCPACGHADAAKNWFTTEQAEYVRQAAFNQVRGELSRAMRRDAESWNRRQSSKSFVSIKMQVKSRPEPVLLPVAATEPMRLRIRCTECQCRYSVIGSAYFCPSCGHNAAAHVFTQSLDKIRASLQVAPTLRTTIEDRDTAENMISALVEGGLQSGVTAFQRYAEALYESRPNLPAVRRNTFQNLDHGSRAWSAVYGHGYDQHLSAADLQELTRYFQQRHLLAHREGLVDADYIARSGDTSYREGQRLIVRAEGVLSCVDLITQLGRGLAADVQASTAPEGGSDSGTA